MEAEQAIIHTDVVICGSGSAGICAAVWLAQAGIPFRILERRSGRLQLGQADGVQCRTVEIFESFGVSELLLRDACQICELTFWSTESTSGQLVRTSRAPDTPPGLSHLPHVVLNQARVNSILLDKMGQLGQNQAIDYDHTVTRASVEPAETAGPYPVRVSATHQGQEKIYRAKYLLACDGAHSTVRRSLGVKMEGDSSDAVWGVMDIFPRTNFPDIRRKSTIHSSSGALLIIPREGGHLVRFYLQMPPGTNAKDVSPESLQERAKSILQGFELEVAETVWWSAYTIGQRLASTFSLGHDRILLAGDACHTHSPKAGQGMNVSLQDGYNIGWKLIQVLRKVAPLELLSTYSLERQQIAADLIDFDKKLTQLYRNSDKELQASEKFKEQFIRSQRFMAGLATKYQDSLITDSANSCQDLARNVIVGMRLPSANVVRHCDARVIQLQQAIKSDNQWRIVVFIGSLEHSQRTQRLDELSRFFASPSSSLGKRMATAEEGDSCIEMLLVLEGDRTKIELSEVPCIFKPYTRKHKIQDLEKIFVDDESHFEQEGSAYHSLGIDKARGALVIVRPDQYVSLVTDISNTGAVDGFFDRIFLPRG